MNWKTCGVTNVSKSKKINYRKVGQKEQKLSRNCQKRKKSCQKVVKKLSLFSIIQCFLCVFIHDIGGFRRLTFNGGWGQKVLSWPSADSFAVGRRQKQHKYMKIFASIFANAPVTEVDSFVSGAL
jgi:hypothetical protein